MGPKDPAVASAEPKGEIHQWFLCSDRSATATPKFQNHTSIQPTDFADYGLQETLIYRKCRAFHNSRFKMGGF